MTLFTATADSISLSAGTAKTVWELGTGPSREAWIVAWAVSFDGTSATGTPVKVEFRRADAGVTTATSLTPLPKDHRDPETSAVTFKYNTTAEGGGFISSGEIHRVHPQRGVYVRYPREQWWHVPRSGLTLPFFRLRCTAAQAVNATFYVEWEE